MSPASLSNMSQKQYDAVVLATKTSSFINEMKKKLSDMDIPEEKIVSVC